MKPLKIYCDDKPCLYRYECDECVRLDLSIYVFGHFEWVCEKRNLVMNEKDILKWCDFDRTSLLAFKQFMEKQ